ncbi:hypothetical protein RQP46_010027 [Phenoliferia psychrophenolica]
MKSFKNNSQASAPAAPSLATRIAPTAASTSTSRAKPDPVDPDGPTPFEIEGEAAAALARKNRDDAVRAPHNRGLKINGTASKNDKGKQKAENQDDDADDENEASPPPKAAPKASKSRVARKSVAASAPKVKKQKEVEVITLDDTDTESDEDEIEDSEDEPRAQPRPPTPPRPGEKTKPRGDITSEHFPLKAAQHDSSDDPLAFTGSRPFKLTGPPPNGAGPSSHAPGGGVVRDRVSAIESKTVAGGLKTRQPQPPPKRAHGPEAAFTDPVPHDAPPQPKKPRTGPAPSNDEKQPAVVLPLTSFYVGDHHFIEHQGEVVPVGTMALKFYSGGTKTSRLVIDFSPKSDGPPTPLLELKPNDMHSILWPPSFDKLTPPVLILVLKPKCGPLKSLFGRVWNNKDIEFESSPEDLLLRINAGKDGAGNDKAACGDDVSNLFQRLSDEITHNWQGVVGAGGGAKTGEFDTSLNEYLVAKFPPEKPERFKPPRRSTVNKQAGPHSLQTTLVMGGNGSGSPKDKGKEVASKPPRAATKAASPPPIRRSARASAAAVPREDEDEDAPPLVPYDPTPPEKVVLIWPHEGVGAVSVTHGDCQRLREEEFLNDTLIELGLKRAFDTLNDEAGRAALVAQGKNPAVAAQVHMFNSFFYKKLSTKKTAKEDSNWTAYSTVRKWTQKFDFFDKKFVVVPINEHLHWYLAIIVNPGAILKAPTKRATRASTGGANEQLDLALEEDSDLGNLEPADDAEDSTTSLTSAFQTAVSLTEGGDGESAPAHMQVDDEGNVASDAAVATGSSTRNPSPELGGGSDMDMGISDDEQAQAKRVEQDLVSNGASTGTSALPHYGSSDDSDSEGTVHSPAANPAEPPAPEPVAVKAPPLAAPVVPSQVVKPKPTLIGPSSEPPKSKTAPVDPEPDMGQQSVESDAALAQQLQGAVRDETKCYIFTFDSLGGQHKAVEKKLKQYLRDEAENKKGKTIDELSMGPETVICDSAHVPQQNNFCDCGLYLLHYVEHFLADPDVVVHRICTQPKPPSKKPEDRYKEYEAELSRIWDGGVAADKRIDMRTAVKGMCETYAEWRKPRDIQDAADREERRRKKAEKSRLEGRAASEKKAPDDDPIPAILERGGEYQRKFDDEDAAKKREQSKLSGDAAQQRHRQTLAELEGGRSSSNPPSLAPAPALKLPKGKSRASVVAPDPSTKGKGRASSAVSEPPNPSTTMKNQDTIVISEDESSSLPRPTPSSTTSSAAVVVEPSTSKVTNGNGASILPPPNPSGSTKHALRSSNNSRQTTPAHQVQPTSVASPDVLIVSPAPKAVRTTRPRDNQGEASDAEPPKRAKLDSPSGSGSGSKFLGVFPTPSAIPPAGTHIRFGENSPSAAQGSSKENGTPSKTASLNHIFDGSPDKNAGKKQYDWEEATANKSEPMDESPIVLD